ncbi:hypothetical protein SAMN02746041_03224 [Desulfacinum hydrothermale DSM 13146]|uniref:Uncharacterized protein n=1 Tax=Desulfacinum hydrothermale DSM 13146 TaxID=1121390 RepID=A0A1W1XXN8_9BACT|nr:hypothetical protein [Desulfacinum hydrothermale]SMC28301.1 hypothetical protein SAMN02746041_03224 [Desulfacinum hydrothermale DSM 13146]
MYRKVIVQCLMAHDAAKVSLDPCAYFGEANFISCCLDELVAGVQQLVLTIDTLAPLDRQEMLRFCGISDETYGTVILSSFRQSPLNQMHYDMGLRLAQNILDALVFPDWEVNSPSVPSFFQPELVEESKRAIEQYMLANAVALKFRCSIIRHRLAFLSFLMLFKHIVKSYFNMVMRIYRLGGVSLLRKLCSELGVDVVLAEKTLQVVRLWMRE